MRIFKLHRLSEPLKTQLGDRCGIAIFKAAKSTVNKRKSDAIVGKTRPRS